MKFTKIISAVLAAVIMTTGMASVVSADELSSGSDTEIVMPAYEIANNPVSQLLISGTTATCKSSTSGNAVSITADQTLEKYWGLWIWNPVDDASWSKTVKANNISMSNNKSGLDSGTYRLKTVFTLTASDGTTESITVYSQEKVI